MAPKKGGKDKKEKAKDPAEDEGLIQSTQFVKKGYPEACAARGVDPLALQLDRGEEGQAAFLRVTVHPGCSKPEAPLTPLHVRALCDALLPYKFLQRLCFWSVAVRDEGTQAVANYLVPNKSLTSLELTDVGMAQAGCKALGDALRVNSTLKELRLDHNPSIGIAGAALGRGYDRTWGWKRSLTFCMLDGTDAAATISSGSSARRRSGFWSSRATVLALMASSACSRRSRRPRASSAST